MSSNTVAASPVLAKVEKLSHEGRGIARLGQKKIFIDGALPGETVSLRMRRRRPSFDEADTLSVVEASARRVEPLCPHTELCGGCSLQHMSPADQVRHKQEVMLEQLRHIGGAEPEQVLEPVTGAHWHYRHRARLSAKFVQRRGHVLVGFREKRGNLVAAIDRCEVLHSDAAQLPARLSELFTSLSIREHIPQVEVVMGDNTGVIVIRHLQPPTEADMSALRRFQAGCKIVLCLQPRGLDSAHALDGGAVPDLFYTLPDHDVVIHFRPGDFTQINFPINRELVARVCALLEPGPEDRVLDLFCGLGNFSLPLARRALAVTGIDGAAALIERARTNAGVNGLANVKFRSAELCSEPACTEVRQGGYNKLVLDPPRSGAREIMRALDPRNTRLIAYVSCNAATLARDAQILCSEKGYRLTHAGIIDMFTHTAHAECLAVFAS